MKTNNEHANLTVYQPHTWHDTLVVRWYLRLEALGDLQIFAPARRTLVGFVGAMQPPASLVFRAGIGGIDWALWWVPFYDGVLAGYWVDPTVRKGVTHVRLFAQALDRLLTQAPFVCGITWQDNLLDLHRRLGYTVSMPLPALQDGKTAWLVRLDRPGFEAGVGWRLLASQKVIHG